MKDFLEEWGTMMLAITVVIILAVMLIVMLDSEYKQCIEDMTRENADESSYVIEEACEEIVYD